MRERASLIEYLMWFRVNVDVGSSQAAFIRYWNEKFMAATGKNLPEGWNYSSDGETLLDQ